MNQRLEPRCCSVCCCVIHLPSSLFYFLKTQKTIICKHLQFCLSQVQAHTVSQIHTHSFRWNAKCLYFEYTKKRKRKPFPWNEWWMYFFLSLFRCLLCWFLSNIQWLFFTPCDVISRNDLNIMSTVSTWNLCCRPKFRIHSQAFIQNKRDFPH